VDQLRSTEKSLEATVFAITPTPGPLPDVDMAERSTTRAWLGLLVASMCYVLVLDALAVAIAFPEIEEAFPYSARTTLAWITTGFTIAIAAVMLLVGQLADRIGWRRTFMTGMGAFACFALIGASASNISVLIGVRVAQGVCAALFTVTAFPLALPAFPLDRRGVAMGWVGVGGATAALLGPVVGGTLVTLTNWRAGLLLPIPLCVLAAVFAPKVFDERKGEKRPIDFLGFLLGGSGASALALVILQRWWLVTPVALVLLLLFGVRVTRHRYPLIRPELFADRRYVWALISQTATQTAIFAWFFSMPLFLVNVWGWSTIESGLAMAVPMLLSFNSVLAGRYADRHGYRMVLSTGGLIAAIGIGWWMIALDNEPSFLALAVGLVVFGWGGGQVGVIGMGAALNSLSDDLLAEGNAALQTNRRLVQGLGAATALAILGNRDASSVTAFRWAWAFAAGAYLISAIVMWWYPADERQRASK